jgi:hypothetical protein
LIEKIDYELKKTKRLAQDYGANLASIGFLWIFYIGGNYEY